MTDKSRLFCYLLDDQPELLMFLGQHVRSSRHGVEPVDTSGVDVVVKALKDLVRLLIG